MGKLTAKQTAFISSYCSNGFNATQAAITAGYSKKTAGKIGQENLVKPRIVVAIDKYKQKIADDHKVTTDSLIIELEEARKVALKADTPQSAAAVSATMGKAKLCGLDRQIIDHQSSDGSMTPKGFNDFYED